MNSTLCHPTAFGVLKRIVVVLKKNTVSSYSFWSPKVNCCGYEQHTVSSYIFYTFKVKCYWL